MEFYIILGLIIAAILLVTTFIHEYGHLWMMRASGVEVEKMAIGIPIRFLTWHTTIGKGTQKVPLSFSPLLIGGYVKATERGCKRMLSLGTQPRMMIAAAGPFVNIFVGLAIMSLVMLFGDHYEGGRYIGAMLLAATASMLVFPRKIMVYVFPVIGVVTFYLVWQAIYERSGIASLEALVETIRVASFFLYAKIILIAFALMNISAGAFNLAPFPPLDGGHQMLAVMDRLGVSYRVQEVYQTLGKIIVLITILADFFI